MSKSQYQNTIEKNEKAFSEKLELELDMVGTIIDDAYAVLEHAMSMYYKSDALGLSMTVEEFKQHLLGELKDVL